MARSKRHAELIRENEDIRSRLKAAGWHFVTSLAPGVEPQSVPSQEQEVGAVDELLRQLAENEHELAKCRV